MLKEFRTFIARGNVLDMAVGIIIGAAFTAIVSSLVEDLINPLIGLFTGGIDLSGLGVTIGTGEHTAKFAYGNFIMAVINFLIVAWVVFLLVKAVNSLRRQEAAAPTPPAAPPPQEVLLTEIRDLLKSR